MHLKSIELQGFKSFIHKTKLEFGPGVSVIVGPNGSGKSNITDAIRWVLGEQSVKTLRGSKMEDVIFSGTKKRKPLGMAEVCLVLDNSDGFLPLEFNEVSIIRRTYRSGEGEYLINNAPCRLKDIHQLFQDTGMGTDGFSIISQGKVDEILSAKAEDRRSIIEETAGIVKYRNRKKEAARKLQDTEQSLDRIRDIIYELASQVEPLREQAERAEVYRALREESDRLEINLLVHTMEDTWARLKEALTTGEKKQQELMETEAQRGKNEAHIEELRLRLAKWDEEINDLQQNVFQVFRQLEQEESEGKLKRARRDAIREELGKYEKEIETLIQGSSQLAQNIALEEERYHTLQGSVRNYRDLIKAREDAQMEKSSGIITMERNIENLKNNSFDLMQHMAELRNKISACSQKAKTLDHLWSKSKEQEKEFMQFMEENEEKQKELGVGTEGMRREMTLAEESLSHLTQKIRVTEKTAEQLNARQMDQREQLQSSKARLNLLQEMQHDYEGYFPGVKAVLLAARKKHSAAAGVVGVMAELIKVPDRVRLAVETALGGGLQDIVTETDVDAKKMIEYLKGIKGGRATFLPLNVIHRPENQELTMKIQGQKGVLGFASELITCETKVRPAVDFLLKRILVVEDMDAALIAARTLKHQVRIVTLEGDQIHSGGSLSGGSQQKKGGNLLSRINEMGVLEQRVKNLTREFQISEQSLADCREGLQREKNILEQKQDQLREWEHQLLQNQREEGQLKEARTMAEKNLQAVREEIFDNRREKEALHREEKLLTEAKAEQEKENENLTAALLSLQEELKEQKANLNEKSDDLTAAKVKLAGVTQEEGEVVRTLQRLSEEKESRHALQAKKQEEARILELELAEKETGILEGSKRLLDLSREKEALEGRLNEEKHNRTAEHQYLTGLEKEDREMSKIQAQLNQELHQWELKRNRWEMEWEKQRERMEEKFSLTFEKALLKKEELPSRKGATMRINEIAREIDDLGTINRGAIEEYQRVSERYAFLTEQQQDLVEAKTSLFKVIGEMDHIMIRRFQDTFEQVSFHFNETFTKLFGGGSAQLRLTDQENILETGVDLVVQPPGKKLQHLNLLSGGEKAMTGIALLFAILNVKPSPFCVLDEIEAALDEANVDRFASYMHELSQVSQFIAVSHRQGTMEIADVLYGITMEENGVSKCLSVKLSDLEVISA
ncbi:chromosome segregation protein SMC [Dehalobacterium formicoaceticum]|uniref:Chromosome partition protein Smc n=1 Tax=Dehalobacterium formicoaceticum TaxID=51515 RepID=A0ABT1Y011_9FIRM|nr:chromosome segregation protein SMC [Dehalobacterium formicoaceticum]MCR6544205.1 chromosome segregation protein SMC [Dehalobacterium formicoaceticum]